MNYEGRISEIEHKNNNLKMEIRDKTHENKQLQQIVQ